MKIRLFWLFVLTCGLLLAMSLLVAGETSLHAPCVALHVAKTPALAAPLPPCEKVARMPLVQRHAPEKYVLPQMPGATPERVAMPIMPYHRAAYFAFHYSDEAG